MQDELKYRTVDIVDDSEQYRESIAYILRSRGFTTRCFGSNLDYLKQWKPTDRGVVVLDRVMGSGLPMGDTTGFELRRRRCAMAILYITGVHIEFDEFEALVRSRYDASVLSKHEVDRDFTKLVAKVDAALEHELTLRLEYKRNQKWLQLVLADLTPTEREVYSLAMKRMTAADISKETGISVENVENHRSAVIKEFRSLGHEKVAAEAQLQAVITSVPEAHDLCDLAAIELAFRIRWMDELLQQELARVSGCKRVEPTEELVKALNLTAPTYRYRRGAIRTECSWLVNTWKRSNRARLSEVNNRALDDVRFALELTKALEGHVAKDIPKPGSTQNVVS